MFIPRESMPCTFIKQEKEYDIIIPHVTGSKTIPSILFRNGMEGNHSTQEVQHNAKAFAEYLWYNVCISFFAPMLNELNRLNNAD